MIKKILIFLNLIFVFLGIGAFWGIAGTSPVQFVILDTLTAAQILTVISLLTGQLLPANIVVPFLFFYGTLQLFLGWEGIWLVQFNNLLVTVTIIYLGLRNFLGFHFFQLVVGFTIGVMLFIPVRIIQNKNPYPEGRHVLENSRREIPILKTFIMQKQNIVKKTRK